MGYGANWRGIARPFEKDFHVLYYDQRGHGRSFSPPTGYAPEDFAGDLKKILDELGWKKIYLVGHSMGGRIAANFAASYPERVEKLVIEDIGPDANPDAIRRIEELLDGIPAPFADKQAAKDYFGGAFFQKFAHRRNLKPLALFLLSNFTETDRGFDWKFDKEVMRRCVREGRARERYEEFRSLTMPTLFIRGRNSEELSREVFERVLAENPRIQGLEIADAGHWVHFDRAGEFIEAVKGFFAG